MTRSVCHVATSAEEGMRLDAFCASCGAYPSRSNAARHIEAGDVLVNGKVSQKRHLVKEGDAVVCEISDDSHAGPIKGEPIPLDVRYEDESIIVLSKQPGLICHPVNEHRDGTLVNALVHRYGVDGLCNVQGDQDRPGIVHRLDGDTSGLMLVAKTDEAGLALMDAIGLREVDRRYMALVHGIIQPDTGLIDAPIMRNPQERTTMTVGDGLSSRDAITTFTVLERFAGDGRCDGYTLVECKLYTGRTHQIRVHMQYIGHPLVGDPVYTAHAPRDVKLQLGLARQFLHSCKLGFEHPVTGEHMEFEDDLPGDLAEALARIKEETA